ncbi:hypothetical protein SAMN05421858_1501 [Haladaptatus litoreus]|uniref:Uncharacterized protein n=1 Tax=Haladaptatus litoreus TaxID=553468 RepID=A0A1N6YBW8_9EURY|nr:hypothetical protein [Haladaptatus litoreus]SIR12122.1 hypothetical protein SAMN05421858_1501 [Haladaptatus litoreus]
MATELFAFVLGFLALVLGSAFGAMLALRTFVYHELDLSKNEVRTAVKHLTYERSDGD